MKTKTEVKDSPTPGKLLVSETIKNGLPYYIIHNEDGEVMAQTVRKTNARLISAAPELLEAAKWVIRNAGIENDPQTDLGALSVSKKYLLDLRAAISKAEGRA
jgi:hypothetical protein